jgi:hypothetical protein
MIVIALEAIPVEFSNVSNDNMAGMRTYEMGATFNVGL